MKARQAEIGLRQPPAPQRRKILGAEPCKLVEQRRQRPPGVACQVAKAIVGLELGVRTAGQNQASPRYPVSLLAVDQMPDDVEGAERRWSFSPAQPRLGEATQHGAKRRRGAGEHVGRLLDIEVHGTLLSQVAPGPDYGATRPSYAS